MKGFSYNGSSTKDILDNISLILCSYDRIDEVDGSSFSESVSSQTILRQNVNEYGSISSRLSFEYSLVKSDYSVFNDEEQRKIESWLTSKQISSELIVFDYNCNDEDNHNTLYYGKFISTKWHTFKNGFSGVTFNFQCNDSYPYRKFSSSYIINGSETIYLNCESEDKINYIYPKITFTQNIGISSGSDNITFTLTNQTDNSNMMKLIAYDSIPIVVDCKYCRIYNELTSNIISFLNLGWNDIGNIYWLRLKNGNNRLDINGNGTLTIEYNYPIKRVGGWI